MYLSSSENMKRADNEAIFARGISSIALMEKAASFLAERAVSYLKEEKSAFVFCGSGKDVTEFKDKNICAACLRELSK